MQEEIGEKTEAFSEKRESRPWIRRVPPAVWFFCWLLLSVPLLFLALDRLIIPDEEHSMREGFGEGFESYRRSVRRWL